MIVSQTLDLPLPEQLVVERACGALWFQAELLSEQAAQLLVAPADGVALAEVTVRLHSEAPEALVVAVECESLLGCLEGAVCVAGG